MVPERRNAVKVLLLLDVGGSMTVHTRTCEELFSAARDEFKHLKHYYFHNCPYEALWRDNRRRRASAVDTSDLLNTYGPDYKLILVGDATMSPYEITVPGGSIEHWNAEAGAAWLERLLAAYPKAVWLNPTERRRWADDALDRGDPRADVGPHVSPDPRRARPRHARPAAMSATVAAAPCTTPHPSARSRGQARPIR